MNKVNDQALAKKKKKGLYLCSPAKNSSDITISLLGAELNRDGIV